MPTVTAPGEGRALRKRSQANACLTWHVRPGAGFYWGLLMNILETGVQRWATGLYLGPGLVH